MRNGSSNIVKRTFLTMIISPQEEYIIKTIRQLKPYEALVIEADKDGKPNRFILRTSQTIMVTEIAITPIKTAARKVASDAI